MARLNVTALRRSEDCYVDELFVDAPSFGVPLICALFPRSFVDVNRSPTEIDWKIFGGTLPGYVDKQSERVRSGLGVIPRLNASGAEIYPQSLPISAARKRLLTYFFPYQRMLRQLLRKAHEQFGHVVLLDCHSMPSQLYAGRSEPDFDMVLGDQYGRSCSPHVIDKVEAVLAGQGYRVARNAPYAGGFVTKHYGRPEHGVDVLQLEVSRALYMDEQTLRRSPRMPQVRAHMASLIDNLAKVQSFSRADE